MGKGKHKKGRSSRTYQNKINKIRKWYEHIEKHRQPLNGKGVEKKPLREASYFIEQLKPAS